MAPRSETFGGHHYATLTCSKMYRCQHQKAIIDWAHTVPAPQALKRATLRSCRRQFHYTQNLSLLATIHSGQRLRHKMEEGYFVLKGLLRLRTSELLLIEAGPYMMIKNDFKRTLSTLLFHSCSIVIGLFLYSECQFYFSGCWCDISCHILPAWTF
jgi:hypothetical protein